MELDIIKRVGLSAVLKGSTVLRSYFGKVKNISKKGVIDLVTEADMNSEKVIIETIKNVFPEHSILAEESGLNDQTSKYQWIIDPLDGTTNYAHQVGLFAISIAFAMDQDIVFAIVLNPITEELFIAAKGKGAMLNNQAIEVSKVQKISESLLVTGFPYNLKSMFNPLMKRFSNCLSAAQGVRRLGSAALDLCFVACGRFDGFWEQNLQPWDTAAGALIAREAGAIVTDFSNQYFTIDQKEILATNGKIHEELLETLKI
jgi:myo-inositol-1(or 4)-monophosphatase